LNDFIFNTTPSIRHEIGSAKNVADVILTMPSVATGNAILFITDPGITKLGLADPAIQSLKNTGFDVRIYDNVEADPKATTILDAAEVAKTQNAQCIIGFGGGSSMDVAKLVALLAGSDQKLDDIFGVNQALGERLPLVLIPTTAGTGSEVTPISIVTTGTDEKKGVVTPIILPDIAILDAELTTGLPPHITAATGVDAMVHAIEAFTSRGTNNNPISKILAQQALILLGANIQQAVTNGTDLQARSNMLLGSMLAGQAFANAPVAAVHALAYPIGSLFHVPHGLSNALVMCAVMRFNATECAAEYAQIAPFIFPNIDTSEPTNVVCETFICRMAALINDLGLQSGLRHVGIKQTDIARLATDAMKQTRLLKNNPRDVSLADATMIYKNSY
jgi:alcohol dehydrogenase class IV